LPSFFVDPASLPAVIHLLAVIHLFAVILSGAKNPRILFTELWIQLEKIALVS